MNLLSFPSEIIADIITDPSLSATDLENLRLTCKGLRPFASARFAQVCFQRVLAFLRSDGLEKVFNICTHPEFGPHVRSLVLNYNVSRSTYADSMDMGEGYSGLKTFQLLDDPGRLSRSVKQILRQASDLTKLKLVTSYGFVYLWETLTSSQTFKFEYDEDLIMSVRSERLVDISLEHFAVSVKHLLQLLANNRESLTSLHLETCILRKGTWNDVVKWILENLLSLQRLELKDVSTASRIQYLTGRYHSTVYTEDLLLEGRKGISDGLRQLLKEHDT